MIAESHIAMHTFPERRLVWADIFSCKDFDATPVLEDFKQRFGLAADGRDDARTQPGAAERPDATSRAPCHEPRTRPMEARAPPPGRRTAAPLHRQR